jgi:cation diffusion facilitator CzcD-associated flavoprotein CzcO
MAQRVFARVPALPRLDPAAAFGFFELCTLGFTSQPWLRPAFRALARRQISKAIEDPELRRKVTPTDEVGCKRVMPTDAWYATLTRPNVELITDPISAVTSRGIRSQDGSEHAVDVIIFATGFETHGFVTPMEITGEGDRTLAQIWDRTPRAYLGLSVPGFPNLFLLYGPNTGGGAGSVIYMIEAGMRHVISALDVLGQADAQRIEVRQKVADSFEAELRTALAGSVWHSGCTNWYVDENGHDPNQWPWTATSYRRRTARIDPSAYKIGVGHVG